MNPELLQTFGVLAIGLGFVLVGLGGFSTYHASQQLQHAAELREAEQKGEMNAQILTLLLKNKDLQDRVEQPSSAAPQETAPPPAANYRPPSPPPPPTFAQPQAATAPEPNLAHDPKPAAPPEPVGEAPDPTVHPAAEPPEPSNWHEPDSLEPSGRYLSGRQRTAIADTLRAHGRHTVTIESSYGDPLSLAFAEELAEAFVEGDWVVRGINEHRGLPLASGVTVSAASFPPLAETRAVYEALLSAGIAVTQQLDPKQHGSETVVLVGVPL